MRDGEVVLDFYILQKESYNCGQNFTYANCNLRLSVIYLNCSVARVK